MTTEPEPINLPALAAMSDDLRLQFAAVGPHERIYMALGLLIARDLLRTMESESYEPFPEDGPATVRRLFAASTATVRGIMGILLENVDLDAEGLPSDHGLRE